jgi:tetratricopeptide (TPR) repeat protein
MTAPAIATLLGQVRQLMRGESLDAADAILATVLARVPDDADALYLRGVIANRRGDFHTAIAVLRRCVAAHPAAARTWLALGNACRGAAELPAAADAYREALTREPAWSDAHHNLGLTLERQGDLAGAARSYHAAWVLGTPSPESAARCVAALGAWVRTEPAIPAAAALDVGPAPPSVCVVVCSIDDGKAQRAERLYRRLFAAIPHEFVGIRDARSLADAYNRAVAGTAADVVVLSHDDVDVLADDFAARLFGHLQRFDAVGVVGAVRVGGPAATWSGHPHLRGWITHRPPGQDEWLAGVLDPQPVAEGIAVLDGVLLAGRREAFAAVPFDAGTFDGFHLYDVDWSCRAALAGFRLAAAADLLVVHASRGRYDEGWRRYAERFCAKHALCTDPPPRRGAFYEVALASRAEVRAFYARLAELALGPRGVPARSAGASRRGGLS